MYWTKERVLSSGPGPKSIITTAWSNSCSEARIWSAITRPVMWRSIGRVMWTARCQAFAPSSLAASYRWPGMPWRAARYSRKLNPTVHHRVWITMASMAYDLSVSQGVSIPRVWLNRPMPWVNSHCHMLAATVDGSRNGTKKHSRHSHLPRSMWWASIARRKAMTVMQGTTRSVKYALWPSASHIAGSFSASR
ncbi:hypothetical protein SGRIM128S_09786 [Streptomyces griseomycini]